MCFCDPDTLLICDPDTLLILMGMLPTNQPPFETVLYLLKGFHAASNPNGVIIYRPNCL